MVAARRPAATRPSLNADPGRITGTPKSRGTFSFRDGVTDTRGAFAEQTFSITIS
jgi:hypothetical protein